MEQSTRKLPAPDTSAAALVSTGSGSALYVINLCASMAPIANADNALPGFEQYRVYQVSRKEDGRIRYRLRLGFFTDEAEAETALACIREHYPTAFATSLCDEDQRHTRGFASNTRPAVGAVATPTIPQTHVATPKKPVIAASPGTKPVTQPAAAAAPPKSSAPTVAQAATSPSDTQRVQALKPTQPLDIELQWEEPTAAEPTVTAPTAKPAIPTPAVTSTPAKPATSAATTRRSAQTELSLAAEPAVAPPEAHASVASSKPFHVGNGVDIPASTLALSLEPEPAPAKVETASMPPAAAASSQSVKKPVAAKPPKPVATTAAIATTKSAVAKPAMPRATKAAPVMPTPSALPKPPVVLDADAPPPDFDSTQTIRALTATELDDETQPKWFAVQLAVSEQPINLDTMPHLDIFSAYRLYSVATAGSGKILHHMRIGFFKEQVSAEAVCGYLKTFFGTPTVLRISVAEQTRFAEAPPRPVVAEAKAKVIELATARDRTPAQEVPVITMEVTPNPGASGRFPKPGTSASGVHKQPAAVKSAARTATAARSAKNPSSSASGKHRTLQEALLAEAREVELSESAIRRLPKNNSLLSKLFGKK